MKIKNILLSLTIFGVVASLTNVTSFANTNIGVQKAKNIALKDANLSAKNVYFHKAKLSYDDGRSVYDVEFYSGNVEYDYEIDATTGRILEKDADIEKFVIPTNTSSSQTTTSTSSITQEKAKSIALKDANLSAKNVYFHKAKLSYDDGRNIYDVEFYSGNVEYDYEIDAATGAILEKDADIEQFAIPANTSSSQTTTSTSSITQEKAKSIALSHAKVNSNSIQFFGIKSDFEDGVKVYEIEFTSNNIEYDYTINATNGAIIEYSMD